MKEKIIGRLIVYENNLLQPNLSDCNPKLWIIYETEYVTYNGWFDVFRIIFHTSKGCCLKNISSVGLRHSEVVIRSYPICI